MRDAHRMKEKFELSLDSRQVTSLLAAGLVVLGAVFVLGVVVGKRLTASTAGAEPADLLTSLDRKAATMVEVRKEPALTFQDELTRKATALPREMQKPVVVEGKPAAAPAPAESQPAPAVPVDTVPQAVAPSVPQKSAEIPPPRPAEKPEDKPAEKPAPPTPAKPVEKEDSLVARSTLQAAFAAVKPAAAMPTEAMAGGAYSVQVKSTQEREDANRFAARLRDRGYAPYVQTVELPGRGTWYRVRVGNFDSRDAASRYLADFKRETKIDAIVTGGK